MAANVKAFPCLATGQSVVAAGIEMHRRLRGAVDGLQRLQAHHSRHAGAAPAEGRSRPHQAALARSRRPQLQFSRRRLADRWRVRAGPIRRRALERPQGLRLDGAARDRQRQRLEHARARQLSLFAAGDGRRMDASELVEVPYPPGFSRGRLDAGTVVKKFNALTAPMARARRARPHRRARDGVGREPLLRRADGALAPEGAASPVRDPPARRGPPARQAPGEGRSRPAQPVRRRRGFDGTRRGAGELRIARRPGSSSRDSSRVDGMRRRVVSEPISSAARFSMNASSVRRVAAMSAVATSRNATSFTSSARGTSLFFNPRPLRVR